MRLAPPARLYAVVAAALVMILAVGLIGGGLLLFARRGQASTSVPSARLKPDAIAPALALRTLAGEDDRTVLNQALEEGKLETAYATLFFSTALTDRERVNYYTVLGQRFAKQREKERARTCYEQATSVLLLSADPFDASKANAHLLLGREFLQLGDRSEGERQFDYAYVIARYSPYVEDSQRRFVLSNAAAEYKALGQERKADECTRALTSLGAAIPVNISPARAELPAEVAADDVKAAVSWRRRAAQRLINTLGGKDASVTEETRRNLEDALRAEDELRTMTYESRLALAATAEERAAVAKSRLDWLILRWRIALKGFGLSLVPSWEKSVKEIENNVRQAMASYYLLRREMAAGLPDAVEAAQGRMDLLREEMMLGRLGLYPDYPENRLISELAQATKDRIDLREDGLYIAILSQEGRGLLVVTTADLWGRPAAMASSGITMSFPTVRPPTFVFVPSPTLSRPTAPPSPTNAIVMPPLQATATATPVLPTRPPSPPATPTNSPVVVFTPTSVAQQRPATATPVPTSTPMPTATPAYNYVVIYRSGPTLRESTGNENFHIVGMVVDQNGVLIPGLQQRLSWCCPAGYALRPRPGIDADNGRFDFFVGRGQFTLDVLDGSATTEPVIIDTAAAGMTGYVEWEVTLQRTSRSAPPFVAPTRTNTATPTSTGTPQPPTPTPPLPGATTAQLDLKPGWNFIALPLVPATSYSGSSLAAAINAQINIQGAGVASVAYWDGARITPYNGDISLGVGYFVNVTGTSTVRWQLTGYPLVAPVSRYLDQNSKTSIAIPYMIGGTRKAHEVQADIDGRMGAGTFVRLWRIRDSAANWDYYDGTATGVPSFPLSPSEGYLIEVSRSFTWSPWQPASATPTSTPTLTPTETRTPTPTAADLFEPNNSFDQAWVMSPDVPIIAYITSPSDVDYYKFAVTAPTVIYLTLTNLPDDYDLYLYNPSRVSIDASFNGSVYSEEISRGVTMSGVYYAVVQPAGNSYDTLKPYKLNLSFLPLSTSPAGGQQGEGASAAKRPQLPVIVSGQE